MIDFKEIGDPEQWELFARDFLAESGFYIESAPDRGADGGKDLLVTENLVGNLGKYQFRWLVSCKHHAVSGRSVSEADEGLVLERLESVSADGFIGFYSTIASSALNTRLGSLRSKLKIKDYRIFDHKLIENYLIRRGYSTLLMRYFPNGYRSIRPLHAIVAEYEPLCCRVCGKDLLEELYQDEYSGNVSFFSKTSKEIGPTLIEDVAWACKERCSYVLEQHYRRQGYIDGWEDIGDLQIPLFYLKFLMGVMNSIRSREQEFTDDAFDKLKQFVIAMAQKTFRETTDREKERVSKLMSIPLL